MTKELIDPYWVFENHNEAADLIEQQQKRIAELEADTKEVNAARIYLREQERLLRQLAAAQAQRDELLAVVKDFDSLIQYQYTGSQEAMSALQTAAWAAHEVLKAMENK